MNTITCDRCGKKLFKEKARGSLYGTYYTSRNFHGLAWLNNLFGDKSIDVDIDLCDDCTKEFAEWLHINDDNQRNI